MVKKIERDEPVFVVEGMEEIIEKDLQKHKTILERTFQERQVYREAISHEIKRKKHYNSLIGGNKFDDIALRESVDQMAINITAMSNKVKLSDDKIDHETLIVDTLTAQLENQYRGLKLLSEHKKREEDASKH